MEPKVKPQRLKSPLLKHSITMKTENYRPDQATNNLNPKAACITFTLINEDLSVYISAKIELSK